MGGDSLPVGLLLLAIELAICLLQLIGEQFQVARQFVIRLKLLRHQDQISSGVVQGDVAQVQTPPGAERITRRYREDVCRARAVTRIPSLSQDQK